MPRKTVYIVQQFEKEGRKLVSGRAIAFRTAMEAVARAERDADRFAGVVAFTQTVEEETGDVIEEPAVLFSRGELPPEFSDQ